MNLQRYIVLILTLSLAACGTDPTATDKPYIEPSRPDDPIGPRLEALGVGDYLGQIHPVSSEPHGGDWPKSSEWTVHRYGDHGQARCFNGTEFVVSERPRSSDKVVIYTQGGGGCWSYDSCYTLPIFVKDDSSPIGEGTATHGILNDEEPKAALTDYSVVFGSYCDGSLWTGDATRHYTSADGATSAETYHWGHRNVSAMITLAKKNYPNASKILITGDSAGGYGTLMSSMVARLAWPEADIAVLNDSGPWLMPVDRKLTEEVLDKWNVRRLIPDDCARCSEHMLYFLNFLLPRDPMLRVGLFMRYDDFTIGTSFLQYGAQFPEVLLSTTDEVHDEFPYRFKRYLTDGSAHTVITSDDVYTINGHGQPLSEWIQALVQNTEAWRDQARAELKEISKD